MRFPATENSIDKKHVLGTTPASIAGMTNNWLFS